MSSLSKLLQKLANIGEKKDKGDNSKKKEKRSSNLNENQIKKYSASANGYMFSPIPNSSMNEYSCYGCSRSSWTSSVSHYSGGNSHNTGGGYIEFPDEGPFMNVKYEGICHHYHQQNISSSSTSATHLSPAKCSPTSPLAISPEQLNRSSANNKNSKNYCPGKQNRTGAVINGIMTSLSSNKSINKTNANTNNNISNNKSNIIITPEQQIGTTTGIGFRSRRNSSNSGSNSTSVTSTNITSPNNKINNNSNFNVNELSKNIRSSSKEHEMALMNSNNNCNLLSPSKKTLQYSPILDVNKTFDDSNTENKGNPCKIKLMKVSSAENSLESFFSNVSPGVPKNSSFTDSLGEIICQNDINFYNNKKSQTEYIIPNNMQNENHRRLGYNEFCKNISCLVSEAKQGALLCLKENNNNNELKIEIDKIYPDSENKNGNESHKEKNDSCVEQNDKNTSNRNITTFGDKKEDLNTDDISISKNNSCKNENINLNDKKKVNDVSDNLILNNIFEIVDKNKIHDISDKLSEECSKEIELNIEKKTEFEKISTLYLRRPIAAYCHVNPPLPSVVLSPRGMLSSSLSQVPSFSPLNQEIPPSPEKKNPVEEFASGSNTVSDISCKEICPIITCGETIVYEENAKNDLENDKVVEAIPQAPPQLQQKVSDTSPITVGNGTNVAGNLDKRLVSNDSSNNIISCISENNNYGKSLCLSDFAFHQHYKHTESQANRLSFIKNSSHKDIQSMNVSGTSGGSESDDFESSDEESAPYRLGDCGVPEGLLATEGTSCLTASFSLAPSVYSCIDSTKANVTGSAAVAAAANPILTSVPVAKENLSTFSSFSTFDINKSFNAGENEVKKVPVLTTVDLTCYNGSILAVIGDVFGRVELLEAKENSAEPVVGYVPPICNSNRFQALNGLSSGSNKQHQNGMSSSERNGNTNACELLSDSDEPIIRPDEAYSNYLLSTEVYENRVNKSTWKKNVRTVDIDCNNNINNNSNKDNNNDKNFTSVDSTPINKKISISDKNQSKNDKGIKNNSNIDNVGAEIFHSKAELMKRNTSKNYQSYGKFYCRSSHQAFIEEFDCLKSVTIDQQLRCVKFIPPSRSPGMISYLAANERTIKLFHIRGEKQLFFNHILVNSDLDILRDVIPHPRVPKRIVMPVKAFTNVHQFMIQSLSLSADCETFLSVDDFQVYWWHLEATDTTKATMLANVKPVGCEEVNTLLTAAAFHNYHGSLFLVANSNGVCDIGDLRHPPCRSKRKYQVSFQIRPELHNTVLHSDHNDILCAISAASFIGHDFVVTRDYTSLKLWDMRNQSNPVAACPVMDYVAPSLDSLYDTDYIFDRFPLAVDDDSLSIVTGLYNSTVAVWQPGRQNCLNFSYQPQQFSSFSSTFSNSNPSDCSNDEVQYFHGFSNYSKKRTESQLQSENTPIECMRKNNSNVGSKSLRRGNGRIYVNQMLEQNIVVNEEEDLDKPSAQGNKSDENEVESKINCKNDSSNRNSGIEDVDKKPDQSGHDEKFADDCPLNPVKFEDSIDINFLEQQQQHPIQYPRLREEAHINRVVNVSISPGGNRFAFTTNEHLFVFTKRNPT